MSNSPKPINGPANVAPELELIRSYAEKTLDAVWTAFALLDMPPEDEQEEN